MYHLEEMMDSLRPSPITYKVGNYKEHNIKYSISDDVLKKKVDIFYLNKVYDFLNKKDA